jgi:DinB superfamily
MLNPYAPHLDGRDPLTILAATPVRLAEMAATPGRAPQPGKWDIRQIVCHLADCEITFAFRLRQALAEDHHIIQPFDQDRWAATYPAYDTAGALAVFRTVRDWNLKFVQSQPAAIFDKPVTHPERGTMTFRTLVETMAGHDLNHLKQVKALAA